MTFNVSGDAYDKFMGRFSQPLAAKFIELLNLQVGQTALDVGSGPGALTRLLVERIGDHAVSAIDPSESFVDALHTRFPGVDVKVGSAEDLQYPSDTFDLATAQLVVHFMSDPIAALREMARVTKPGGRVAACVWDEGQNGGPIAAFWTAAYSMDPSYPSESHRAGTREGHLVELFAEAGFEPVEPAVLSVSVHFATFEEWWHPYTLGVGPAGDFMASLDDAGREEIRARCAKILPATDFTVDAIAWTAIGRV
jgi:ubiquinone/menaquinone biosynthesis C-methylase UbiE